MRASRSTRWLSRSAVLSAGATGSADAVCVGSAPGSAGSAPGSAAVSAAGTGSPVTPSTGRSISAQRSLPVARGGGGGIGRAALEDGGASPTSHSGSGSAGFTSGEGGASGGGVFATSVSASVSAAAPPPSARTEPRTLRGTRPRSVV